MNKMVVVTSGTRGTMRTTSIIALGSLLAEAGNEVLLLNCDFHDPSLAEQLAIEEPAATIQDVIVGGATIRDALHSEQVGLSVVPCATSDVPDPELLSTLNDAFDGFDVIICDTGDPFNDATTDVLDRVDGVLTVSIPGPEAYRNILTLHQALRGRNPTTLDTVLTRVTDGSAGDDWDCDVLASISESSALSVDPWSVLESPSDPVAIAYRDLADDLVDRLGERSNPTSSTPEMWLSPPADPFVTPGSVAPAAADGPTTRSAVTDGGEQMSSVDVDKTTPPTSDTDDSNDTTEKQDGEGGFRLTRRGVLAATAAAVGGVSAGILNTTETTNIDAFGYGGAPILSNESSTTAATNDTMSSGEFPTTGPTLLEPTSGTEEDNETQDQPKNETETAVEHNTDPNEEPDFKGDSETNDQIDDGSEFEDDTTSGTGGSGTGGARGSDDGTKSGDETKDSNGTGSDDGATDEPSSSVSEDDPYGTVGYGQGGYGGVT